MPTHAPQMLQEATTAITRWSLWIGLVQRFTLGFPLCLACGFFGVGQLRFALGVVAGSVLTLVLQVRLLHWLYIGMLCEVVIGVQATSPCAQLGGAYLLKDRPALCLSAVALFNAFELVLPLVALGWVGLQRLLSRNRSEAAEAGVPALGEASSESVLCPALAAASVPSA